MTVRIASKANFRACKLAKAGLLAVGGAIDGHTVVTTAKDIAQVIPGVGILRIQLQGLQVAGLLAVGGAIDGHTVVNH